MESEAFARELAICLRGQFLVLDGPDGSGKTTQARRLVDYLIRAGGDVVRVREPGGTRIGEAIRTIVLDARFEEMDVATEMLLFMASRAQLVREVVIPALSEGHTVIADRFLSSTIAYQGATRRLAKQYGVTYLPIASINRVATVALGRDFPKYRTFIFSVDLGTSLKRMHGGEVAQRKSRALHGSASESQTYLFGDRMDIANAQFHKKVRRMYEHMIRKHPKDYVGIDARGTEDQVFQRLLATLRTHFHVKQPLPAANEIRSQSASET